MSDYIGPYLLTKPLSNANAGNCRWGFVTRDGNEYFIKELLDPVYPIDEVNLSPAVVKRKKKLCQTFECSQSSVLKRINECSDGNVMRIVDFFRYGSKYYLVGEKIDAIDSKRHKQLTYDNRLTVCRALAHALMCLHEAGLVNGDIKLSNIMIYATRTGNVSAKIIDVDGCYWKAKPPTNPDDITTDQAYMAPEVFAFIRDECGVINEKSDIFSMGLCMHEILSGSAVSLASNCNYPFQHVLDNGKLPLSSKLPAEMRALLGQMLAKKPEERPSAREVFVRLWNGCPPRGWMEDKQTDAIQAGKPPVREQKISPTDKEDYLKPNESAKTAGAAGEVDNEKGGTGLKKMRKTAPAEAEEVSWFKKAGNL